MCKHRCAPPKKECNKLDLTVAQYFWLVLHNALARWFAISNSHIHAVRVTVLSVGLAKKKKAKLRHLILLSRLTYWAPVQMLSQSIKWCKALWKTKCLHAWAFHFLKCIVMAFSTLWYPMGTHWIPISFHGKTILKKKLCWSFHSITPLDWGSFESKDPSFPS